MNRSQKVILVIALGVLAVTVDRAFAASSVASGWMGYAPDAETLFGRTMEPGRQLLLRLALLISWTLVSLRLLKGVDPS